MKPISGERLVAILRRKGWTLERTRGSHQTWYSPDRVGSATVPVHGNKDLRPGTQASLMKRAGLTEADL